MAVDGGGGTRKIFFGGMAGEFSEKGNVERKATFAIRFCLLQSRTIG
jgi:hypothetical protein